MTPEPGTPLENRVTVQRLFALVEAGMVSPEAVEAALGWLGLRPDVAAWRRFADRMLLLLGTALLLAGVVFFFAYNWDDLGRLAKLGLVGGLFGTLVAGAWWKGIDTRTGEALLVGAAVLTGVWLGVFGQLYQTGADAWSLFALWAVLIVGWVGTARSPALWLLWLVLLQVSLGLWWDQRFVLLEAPGAALYLLLFAVNAGALAGWEAGQLRGVAWMQGRWMPRLLALVALGIIVQPVFELIFDQGQAFGGRRLWLWPGTGLYAAGVALSLWCYRQRPRDVLVLAMVLLSVILVVGALLMRAADGAFTGFLLAGLVVVGLGAAAARWLIHLANAPDPSRH
jgi:uncharacterized membrane protein